MGGRHWNGGGTLEWGGGRWNGGDVGMGGGRWNGGTFEQGYKIGNKYR